MKDTDIIEDKFGEIELKLLKDKVLKDVENILNQVSGKNEDFIKQYDAEPCNTMYSGNNKKWTVAEVMKDVIKAISFIENVR